MASSDTQPRPAGATKKIAFAALHHKDFRIYFIGTMLAMMADNIEHVISYWLLYQKFQSPTLAGFAVLGHWTPFLLFLGLFWRAGGPLRLPQSHSDRANHVHGRVGDLGVSVLHGYHPSLARLRLAGDSRHGGSALGAGQPTPDPRHRRHRTSAKRRSPQLHESTTRSSLWAGRGRRLDAFIESVRQVCWSTRLSTCR